VKAFLKSEERKRDKDRRPAASAKLATPAAPAANATPAPPVVVSIEQPVTEVQPNSAQASGAESANTVETVSILATTTTVFLTRLQSEQPKDNDPPKTRPDQEQSAILPTDGQLERASTRPASTQPEQSVRQDAGSHDGNAAWSTNGAQNQNQNQVNSGGLGYNGGQAGFVGMDWNSNNGFTPMMQMQNGMSNGNWNAFPNMMGT